MPPECSSGHTEECGSALPATEYTVACNKATFGDSVRISATISNSLEAIDLVELRLWAKGTRSAKCKYRTTTTFLSRAHFNSKHHVLNFNLHFITDFVSSLIFALDLMNMSEIEIHSNIYFRIVRLGPIVGSLVRL